MRATSPVAVALVSALLVAAACSDDEPERDASATTTAAEASTTTAEATTTAPGEAPESTAPVEPVQPAALRGDGLGLASFGAAPDDVIVDLAALLGEPSEDTGWQPAFNTFGTCPGENIRAARWGGLTALFTDGTTDYASGQHFFQWRQSAAPPPIATIKGLSVGATLADAEELYGEVVVTEEELVGGPVLEVDVEGGRLIGFLDDADIITNLEAGAPCGE